MTPTTNVTVIGTGAIGSEVATTLMSAGHRVVVWNRTPSRMADLVAAGAAAAPTPAEAARSAELVLATLTDYAAVDDVLRAAGDGLAGRTVVVLSTGTPDEARRAAAVAEQHGAAYLDAGVRTAPDDIGTDRASFLFSGPREVFDRHREVLQRLGGSRHVGEAPEAAATWDLLLFGIWYDAQLGLLRALAEAQRAGLDLAELADAAVIQLGHVVDAARSTAAEVGDQAYPRGPADLREHLAVVEQLERARIGGPLGTGGLADVRRRLEQAIAAGHGEKGLTALTAV